MWLKTLLRKNNFLSIFICKIHLVDTCTVILLTAINSTVVYCILYCIEYI